MLNSKMAMKIVYGLKIFVDHTLKKYGASVMYKIMILENDDTFSELCD